MVGLKEGQIQIACSKFSVCPRSNAPFPFSLHRGVFFYSSIANVNEGNCCKRQAKPLELSQQSPHKNHWIKRQLKEDDKVPCSPWSNEKGDKDLL
jgi:hypothetical protein